MLTPTQLGRQELYTQVPFTAVMGLQRTERNISQAFASYAAGLDAYSHTELSAEEKVTRTSRTTMIIMDELEFDANLVSCQVE